MNNTILTFIVCSSMTNYIGLKKVQTKKTTHVYLVVISKASVKSSDEIVGPQNIFRAFAAKY